MNEFEVAREFLSQVLHMRYVGAGVTLCGITTLGMFIRKFVIAVQMGGPKGCPDCLEEYRKISTEQARKREKK